jgi:hypothetical protein
MSWLYSRALVEASSVDISLDGAPCALWSGTHMQRASWLPGKTTAASRLSRSGMTYKALTDDLGEAVLTWCLEDSHARTSRGPGTGRASKESDLDSGPRCSESSAKSNLDTSSSRTSATSVSGASRRYAGTCSDLGTLFQMETSTPQTVEPLTYVSAHSFSRTGSGRGWSSRVSAKSASAVESQSARVATSIIQSALARDLRKTDGLWKRKVGELLPTPTAQDAKNNAGPSQYNRNTWPLNVIAGGTLSPMWVEWLMGFPIGWTGLDALETPRFQQWLLSHGVSLEVHDQEEV